VGYVKLVAVKAGRAVIGQAETQACRSRPAGSWLMLLKNSLPPDVAQERYEY
jgi:hypothetical protein